MILDKEMQINQNWVHEYKNKGKALGHIHINMLLPSTLFHFVPLSALFPLMSGWYASSQMKYFKNVNRDNVKLLWEKKLVHLTRVY